MKNNLLKESEFFKDIAAKVISLIDSSENLEIVEDKGGGDYALTLDVAVEKLIVIELQKRFPNDTILAEEGHSDTEFSEGRMWLIDPICGTGNLGKGLNTYCTNIALINSGELVASCVIDHSQNDYVWSIGNGQIYINNELMNSSQTYYGIKVDVDFGSVRSVGQATRKKHNNSLFKLVEETEYDIISLNSSLGFMYTSIGKLDGFINVYNHPWDIAAASFLIQQAGGVITTPDGSPWTIRSVGAIGASSQAVHQKLLDIYTKS